MAEIPPAEEAGAEDWTGEAPRRRRRWPWLVALLLAGGMGAVWLTRERIADNVIASQLEQSGVKASYRIDSVGPARQVLSHIVIGDPANPDLTIERAEVEIAVGFGMPSIGRVTLVRPRLHGSYRGGKLSFGALDPMIFGKKSAQPSGLPDLDLAIEDARALLDSDAGPIGAKLEGQGNLAGGFAGILAINAPRLAGAGCRADKATLYGDLTTASGKARIAGPLRLAALDCPSRNLRLRNAALTLDAALDATLDGGEGEAKLLSGALAQGPNRVGALGGTIRASWRKQALTARYALTAGSVATPQASAASLSLDGQLRGPEGLARIESEGTARASGIRLGAASDGLLASLQRSAEGTLVAPLLGQMRQGLAREGRNASMSADYVLRQQDGQASLIVPQGALRGASGSTLLAVSHLQWRGGGGAAARLAGNFATGGAGLPRITGRMERRGRGMTLVRMAMAEYRAGTARLALPELVVAQGADGAIGFSGRALASGALPGGHAEGLELPLDGRWSGDGELYAWRGCRQIKFTSLAYANLTLSGRSLALCPGPRGAILRYGRGGLALAAGAPALDLAGHLGETPIRIASGPVGFALPGDIFAKKLEVTLGAADAPTRFSLSEVSAKAGKDIAGSFAGAEVRLASVPLDLVEAAGQWRYADGALTLSGGAFRVLDREQVDRFNPLIARDAVLTLVNNRIEAKAALREPDSDRLVTEVAIAHDLGSGRGFADLAVPGITFDARLQPDTLTPLALSVIANTHGTVIGKGRIDWTPDAVTSTGSFTTDGLDFAAAFGPVRGLSGTVNFTDLLGLTTAPDQRLKIAAINPGIEVADGVMSFDLHPDALLVVNGASWPFLDGKLRLLPTSMVLGAAEERRFELQVEGVESARFIEKMELANLLATGKFDGTLPLVFDENGGRIEGGVLVARAPGGNVSYVGALTYSNLSPMANYAFEALKSMDYKKMRIAMDGNLAGELVTRVRFDGVSQGKGAKRSFITRRLAALPLQFNVNIRAPFYQLITNFKSMSDPEFVRDPRDVGLMDGGGKPVKRPKEPPPPAALDALPPSSGNNRQQGIQPTVSEKSP